MEKLIYRPDVYEGKDPYIFMSYHQADREQVMPILERLDNRGFRFWLNDGVAPGMETDDIIAEHIENCDFFVAFLSGAYLASLDTVDELNYSRDVGKEYLLIYLEDVTLPAGLDMRFMRAQRVNGTSLGADHVYGQLVNIKGADRFFGIADESLRPEAEKIFEKLDRLYPEHKVFALHSVSKRLAAEISELYIKAGYPSVDRLMLDYGFEHISSEEARILRNSVVYQPGFEPDVVKPRIDSIMETLSAEYPNKMILDNLSKSHSSIYSSLLGLSVWMGYDSVVSMLNAYGFSGISAESGRTAIDHKQLLAQIRQRYSDRRKADTMAKLRADNPDLAAGLKTLSNRSQELYGMSLLQYLRKIGLLEQREKTEASTKTAQSRKLLLERIRQLYAADDCRYGTFADAEESLEQLVIRENIKGQVYVKECIQGTGTLRLPLGIHYIGQEAFAGQSDITQLIMPPTLREIKDYAFADCSGLESLIISDGIERIGNNAFVNCGSLRKVCFPPSLKYIGSEAFAGCEALEEVYFGNPRINIQEDAFAGCIFELDTLQDSSASPAEHFELKVDRKNTAKILAYTGNEEVVVIPGMIGGHPITSIEKGCFKDNAQVKEIYINDSIEAINADAFRNCVNLEKVHISNAVSKFTASAFAGCTSLAEVNIPDSMTDVVRGLFKESPLTTVYIGKGVKNLSPDAFYKGEMDFTSGAYFKKKVLDNLVVDPKNESFSADGTILLSKDGKLLVAELGNPVKVVIPEGVEQIGAMAFERLGSLREVEFPSTLKRIGEKAFAGTGLEHVEFPPSLEQIDQQAFSFCRNLIAAEFLDGLKIIAQQAFEGCPIRDVYIPASVEILGSGSFQEISTYQGNAGQRFRVDSANPHILADGVALYQKDENGITLVKAYARNLRPAPNAEAGMPVEYSVREGTTAIAPHAFARCANLRSVTLPEGLLSIGDMAFWDCHGLSRIRIPESCTQISLKAFFGINISTV